MNAFHDVIAALAALYCADSVKLSDPLFIHMGRSPDTDGLADYLSEELDMYIPYTASDRWITVSDVVDYIRH